MCLALVFVVVHHTHVQLRILTPLLKWKRCPCSESSPFSLLRIIFTKFSAGCGCSLQLVILLKISSKFDCLLYAVSQSILFTQIQICLFSVDRSISNAVASVLGYQCNLRDVRRAVLRASGSVSIINCSQSAKFQKELFDPNEGGCVSAKRR